MIMYYIPKGKGRKEEEISPAFLQMHTIEVIEKPLRILQYWTVNQCNLHFCSSRKLSK